LQLADYENDRSFFQLFRFDFTLNRNLKLFLLKVSGNPQLTSTAADASLLEDLFNLIGLGTEMDIVVDESDLKLDVCETPTCTNNNNNNNNNENNCQSVCRLCWSCLDDDEKFDLRMAAGEQVRRGHFKRLFPDINMHSYFMSELNGPHLDWFKHMCKQGNANFC